MGCSDQGNAYHVHKANKYLLFSPAVFATLTKVSFFAAAQMLAVGLFVVFDDLNSYVYIFQLVLSVVTVSSAAVCLAAAP